MTEPEVASTTPFKVDLEPGVYWWCGCGKSANQPFCDGSHKGGAFTPMKLELAEAKSVWLCGCKRSARRPFCDGTHKTL